MKPTYYLPLKGSLWFYVDVFDYYLRLSFTFPFSIMTRNALHNAAYSHGRTDPKTTSVLGSMSTTTVVVGFSNNGESAKVANDPVAMRASKNSSPHQAPYRYTWNPIPGYDTTIVADVVHGSHSTGYRNAY